jgi:tRNA(Ile)-lysidine synthase TilS/MesJ
MQPSVAEPDLPSYDLIVANISGGKDSQVMLDVLMQRGREQGVENMQNKVVAVHADLGRVEWAGTREIAEYHANEYGVRFMAVSRPQGDLLEHIEARGMFPSASARYCTSDHKRGQVAKVITLLISEKREAGELEPPFRPPLS